MNLPIDKVTQLQDIYIFETAINQTVANIQKKKKNYFRLSLFLLALLIVSLIWSLSTYKSLQAGFNLTSNINNNISNTLDTFTTTTTTATTTTTTTTSTNNNNNNNNIEQHTQTQSTQDNTLYNTDVFQNRDDQSNLQQKQNTSFQLFTLTFEFGIVLIPSIILFLSFLFSLIIYFSIDDPFLFISRCNSTLYLFNIYYCFTNKKIMILPNKFTTTYSYNNNSNYSNNGCKSSSYSMATTTTTTFQQQSHNNSSNVNSWNQNNGNNNNNINNNNSYIDEGEFNHRGNRLTPTANTTSTVHRTKKFDNLNNATIIIGNGSVDSNGFSY